MVIIVGFRDGKITFERIYWDQASVLVQVSLLDPETLPVVGSQSGRPVLDPTLPSNLLITRASQQPSPLAQMGDGRRFVATDASSGQTSLFKLDTGAWDMFPS